MQITLPKARTCPECGNEPIYHARDYIGFAIDTALTPFFSSLGTMVMAPLAPLRKRKKIYWGVHVSKFLAAVCLGEFLESYDDKTLLLDQVLWDTAIQRGILMREFRFLGLPLASFVAVYPSGKEIYFGSYPTPPGISEGAWWIDTKTTLKKKLSGVGIPVARGGGAITRRGALKIFRSLIPPVIVKPYQGSGSRHTTTHVTSERELLRAFDISQQISPMSIIEEELMGAVYRPTLVGGKLIATIRRDQPQALGDGVHTIEQLIEEENKNTKRGGPYYSKIVLGEAHLAELVRQHMTPASVPSAGEAVLLHQKINWSVGGTTTDVTDEVHPENKELFEKIAKLLGGPVIGLDFIIGDISKSWRTQERCGVIEANSRPFFDNHHLPFKGKPRDVAGAVWDYAETGKIN